jgi:hypothetical protein
MSCVLCFSFLQTRQVIEITTVQNSHDFEHVKPDAPGTPTLGATRILS